MSNNTIFHTRAGIILTIICGVLGLAIYIPLIFLNYSSRPMLSLGLAAFALLSLHGIYIGLARAKKLKAKR